jgi:hypothetical protein
MAKKSIVDHLYEQGRHFPDRAPNSEHHPRPNTLQRDLHKHREPQAPQHYENFRDVTKRHPGDESNRYDNDVGEKWTRGFGDPYPHFDRGNSWRTDRDTGMRDQIKDRPADHNRHWTEFTLKHNAGTTHEQQAHDFSKRHIPQYERRGELGVHKSDDLRGVLPKDGPYKGGKGR